ncbi:hypothetical protein APR08_001457 [Nocardia amikacinitolerans]|nr:hypothetical protein [Nocardia amikacinitolerans]
MTSGARAFLVAGAAAGALGVGLVPIAGSTPTNSEPAWPTDTTECCATSYMPPSTDPPVTTTTNDPPVTTANDSSVATTTNDPQEATTTDPQATTTTAQPTVPTTTGSFVAPPFDTTSPTAPPILTTITQSAVPPPFDTGSPTASPAAEEKQQDSRLGDALGVGAFLLALGGAALVTRRRRGRPAGPAPEHARDALPPQLRVRVVGDIRPSIHVREVAGVGAPAVRVLLTVGEPRLQVREVP